MSDDEIFLDVQGSESVHGAYGRRGDALMDVPEGWVPVAARRGAPRAPGPGSIPVFFLPERHRAVYELIRALRLDPRLAYGARGSQGVGVRLARLNGRRPSYTREATRWLMLARALSGCADLIAKNASGIIDGEDQELARRARRLAEEVHERRGDLADPLPITHRAYVDEVRRVAEAVLRVLSRADYGQAVRDLALDRRVAKPTRLAVLAVAQHAVNDAAVQVSKTPLQPQIVQLCEDVIADCHAVEQRLRAAHPRLYGDDAAARDRELDRLTELPDADAFAAVNTAAGVLNSSVGNTPFGSDSAAVALAKVVFEGRVLTRRFEGATFDRAVDWYMRCVGRLSADEATTLRSAMRGGNREEVRDARELLGERFQSSYGVSLAVATFSAIQLASALRSIREEGLGPGSAAAAAQSGAGVAAGLWGMRAARPGPIPIQVGRWLRSTRDAREVMEVLDRGVSTTFAVVNIIGGVAQVLDGVDRGDATDITVGALNAGSGAFCFAAVMFGVPGLQPVAGALGLVATAIEGVRLWRQLTQPGWVRAIGALEDGLTSARPSYPRTAERLWETGSMARFRRPIEQVLEHLQEHYGHLDRVTFDGARTAEREGTSADEGATLAAAEFDSAHALLRSLGFSDEQRTQLIWGRRFDSRDALVH